MQIRPYSESLIFTKTMLRRKGRGKNDLTKGLILCGAEPLYIPWTLAGQALRVLGIFRVRSYLGTPLYSSNKASTQTTQSIKPEHNLRFPPGTRGVRTAALSYQFDNL